jgi:uracil-DNA glycosylase family 4
MSDTLLKKLKEKGLPVVEGEGPRSAKLVLLGEALGAEEVLQMRPFAPRRPGEKVNAGVVLESILKASHIQRSEVYLMNVVPTRPPENDLKRLSEYGITLEECQEWAKAELRAINPTCILSLGGVPLSTLVPHASEITSWRGSILEWEGRKVIGTFHPAYILRLPDKTAKKEREGEAVSKYTYGSARLTTILDTRRAKQESGTREIVHPDRNLEVTQREDIARGFFEEAKAAPLLAFDAETRGNWIDCISFSFDPSFSISISRDNPWADDLIREVLWNHEGLVAQNGAFDMQMLLGNGLPVRRLAFDTMVAHHFLYPELPHDLAYLTSIYTKEPYYKWMNYKGAPLETRWRYNALDAACTLEIAYILRSELQEFKIESEFLTHVMPLFHTILKMGLRGVPVDRERKERLQKALTFLIARKEKKAKALIGLPDSFNLRSNKQLATHLYETLKLPKQFDRKTKKVTVDEEAIKKLAKIKGHENLSSILDVRDLEKKKSTYADVVLSFDGRLRTQYSITGTETGRLSSKESLFGEGWNSQTAPPWFRKLIIPEHGYILLEADLKFAEALILAWKAKDYATIEAVRNGEDIYRWHGSRMLGKPPSEISKEERDMIKPVVLGCGYGLGPLHMAEMMAHKELTLPDGRVVDVSTGITVAKAKALRDLFFKSCPAIGEYQRSVQDQLRKTRLLVTAFNRRRLFLGRMGEELFRKGYAQYPQSMCVDYMNRAMVRVDLRLRAPAALLLQIHDAMLVHAPKEMENEVVQIMVEELAVPVVIDGEPLVIPTEIKTSEKSWRDMKLKGIYNGFKAV